MSKCPCHAVPVNLNDNMKTTMKTTATILKNIIQSLVRLLGIPHREPASQFKIDPVLSLSSSPSSPKDRHSNHAVDLDQRTATGLTLREALPVRTAEYWLSLGLPALALEELETLSATARRHPWPRQVAKLASSDAIPA